MWPRNSKPGLLLLRSPLVDLFFYGEDEEVSQFFSVIYSFLPGKTLLHVFEISSPKMSPEGIPSAEFNFPIFFSFLFLSLWGKGMKRDRSLKGQNFFFAEKKVGNGRFCNGYIAIFSTFFKKKILCFLLCFPKDVRCGFSYLNGDKYWSTEIQTSKRKGCGNLVSFVGKFEMGAQTLPSSASILRNI